MNWRRLRRRGEVGETALLTVLLVLVVATVLAGIPFERFVGVVRFNTAVEQSQMMAAATQEIQEQAVRSLEAYLLPRIGAHFQSSLERSPALRNDLALGYDPLPDVTYREAFFHRVFAVPHMNTWLADMASSGDARLNAAYEYLSGLRGAAVLEVRYIGEVIGSVNGPEYILQCDLRVESSETGGGGQVRLASFPCRFSFQRPGVSGGVVLPGLALHPEYE